MARLEHVLGGGDGVDDYIEDLRSKLVERRRLGGLLLLHALRFGRRRHVIVSRSCGIRAAVTRRAAALTKTRSMLFNILSQAPTLLRTLSSIPKIEIGHRPSLRRRLQHTLPNTAHRVPEEMQVVQQWKGRPLKMYLERIRECRTASVANLIAPEIQTGQPIEALRLGGHRECYRAVVADLVLREAEQSHIR